MLQYILMKQKLKCASFNFHLIVTERQNVSIYINVKQINMYIILFWFIVRGQMFQYVLI